MKASGLQMNSIVVVLQAATVISTERYSAVPLRLPLVKSTGVL